MKLLIDIPDKLKTEIYNHGLFLCPNDKISLVNAINHGTPQETVTEFADRCRECGAKYGKLLKQKLSGDLISREDIEECKELMTDINGDTVYAVRMSDIRQLPSVKPKESCDVPDTNDGKMSKSPTDAKDVIWYSKRNYSEIVVEPQETKPEISSYYGLKSYVRERSE